MLKNEICGRVRNNNSITHDSKIGLFRDENGKHFVIQNIHGDYVTTEISESDYDKWFKYFAENVFLVDDDNDTCNPEEAEKIVAVEGYACDVEQLFWDGKKLFIQYMSTSYSACKIISAEDAKAWVNYHIRNDIVVHSGFIKDAIKKIDSLNS